MFCGKYKVYLDGQLVAEKENAITKSGRQIILKSLMGQIPTIGGSIQMNRTFLREHSYQLSRY